MTEEEASKRWCPFARYVVTHNDEIAISSHNRISGTFTQENPETLVANVGDCLGSRCMAWRWLLTEINPEKTSPDLHYLRGHGYCGLAGKP